MPELSQDVVALLQYLLPGFLVAWVFYGLTSHQKPSQFERIIQALIFTLAVRVLVFFERMGLEYLGRGKAFLTWNLDTDLVFSFISAILLGFAVAYTINTGGFHGFLRDIGISRRSAHPSEWCGTLADYARYVVLHLKDDRRLYGWPQVWPSDPEKGHFFVTFPSWIDVDGKEYSLDGVEGILVNVVDVRWVEFLNEPEATSWRVNHLLPQSYPGSQNGRNEENRQTSTRLLPIRNPRLLPLRRSNSDLHPRWGLHPPRCVADCVFRGIIPRSNAAAWIMLRSS